MSTFHTHYQAANLSDAQVRENFVVRAKEFERVMADIRSTPKGTSFQHYVFVGRRGSGKSTLLRRIQAEIRTDEDLSARFLVTNLSEEQAGVYRLHDLWDYVIRDLKAQKFDVPDVEWQDYEDDLQEYTKALYAVVHTFLEKEGKQLVLLVDNIDRVFKSIGEDANLLRAQLMNFNDVRIIGGSTIMVDDFWRYDLPFYQFFTIKRLEALSMGEIEDLLNHWAKEKGNPEIAEFVKLYPGKIQVVRTLTDGTPRTMQLFVEMLINRQDERGYEYLRRIIDHATPIYQERLLQLSGQQQKIVVELSLFWEAASIEQMVPVCKMKGKDISAQMAQLVKARIVEKVKWEKKKNYYRLEERFFNLWLLMTQGGPKQKREAKYLTVFLEAWYAPEELQDVFKAVFLNLYTGNIKQDYAIAKALSHSKNLRRSQTDQHLRLVAERSPDSIVGKQNLPEKTWNITEKSIELAAEKGWEEGIKLMNTIEQLDWTVSFFFLAKTAYKRESPVEDLKEMLARLPKDLCWRTGTLFFFHNTFSKYWKWNKSYESCVDTFFKDKSISSDFSPVFVSTALWAGKMEKFETYWVKTKPLLSELDESAVHNIIQNLCIFHQYNKLLEAFHSEEYGPRLKEIAKPHYYALLSLAGGHESELQRMPPELKQSVSDLVAYIRERQAFFNESE